MNRMLVLAVVLAASACTVTEEGQPSGAAWLEGTLAFRKVEGQPVPASGGTGNRPAPQPADTDEARAKIQQAKATRQSTDAEVRRQALTQLDCGAADPLVGHDDATLPLVTCDGGEFKYDLGPAFLDGASVTTAEAKPNEQAAGWLVSIELDAAAARTWADFTAANVGSQVAILVNGRVVSAPTIQSAITGGATQISGRFTKAEAEQLAEQLGGR